MKTVKKIWSSCWIYVAAFCIPWLVVVAATLYGQGWVTGKGTLLVGDTASQIVPFAYELWNKYHEGAGLIYTWNIAAGCAMSGVKGYFVSPFTILILLSPKSQIVNMVQIVMILIGLMWSKFTMEV